MLWKGANGEYKNTFLREVAKDEKYAQLKNAMVRQDDAPVSARLADTHKGGGEVLTGELVFKVAFTVKGVSVLLSLFCFTSLPCLFIPPSPHLNVVLTSLLSLHVTSSYFFLI